MNREAAEKRTLWYAWQHLKGDMLKFVQENPGCSRAELTSFVALAGKITDGDARRAVQIASDLKWIEFVSCLTGWMLFDRNDPLYLRIIAEAQITGSRPSRRWLKKG